VRQQFVAAKGAEGHCGGKWSEGERDQRSMMTSHLVISVTRVSRM